MNFKRLQACIQITFKLLGKPLYQFPENGGGEGAEAPPTFAKLYINKLHVFELKLADNLVLVKLQFKHDVSNKSRTLHCNKRSNFAVRQTVLSDIKSTLRRQSW